MKLSDIYKTEPITNYNFDMGSDLWGLEKVLPEIDFYAVNFDKNKHVQRRTHFYNNGDGYRTTTIGSIWFREVPILVFAKAGRGGDEYAQRWITNKDQFTLMVGYLKTLEENEVEDIYDESEDVLDWYYNHDFEIKDNRIVG